MKSSDFEELGYVTEKMIVDSGGNIEGMNFDAVFWFDQFAADMNDVHGFKVLICHNGCNSGNHKSKEHEDGHAIDFYFDGKTPAVWHVVCELAFYGFKAIGVYLNQKGAYSFHADNVRYRQWGMWTDKAGVRHSVAIVNDLKGCIK